MKRAPFASNVIATVRKELRTGTQLDFPAALVREVIEREPELAREVRRSRGGLDTDVRELFLETASRLLIGASWPLNRDTRARAAATLRKFRTAAEARGVKFPSPEAAARIGFVVKTRDDGIHLVSIRGAIDESNVAAVGSLFMAALGGFKGKRRDTRHRVALDFSAASWTRTEHALHVVRVMTLTLRFRGGSIVVFGVAPDLQRRLDRLKPDTAPELHPDLAASAAEAFRMLKN